MSKRKALKSTWFNRLAIVPLILMFWILFYPPFVILVGVVGGFIIAMKEYVIDTYWTIREESVDYLSTIRDGFKFITGRIVNK